MKPDTRVFYRFESVGQPRHTLKGQDSVREVMLIFARWILSVYMGQKIRIILARSEEELQEGRRSASVDAMISDLESLVNVHEEGETESETS